MTLNKGRMVFHKKLKITGSNGNNDLSISFQDASFLSKGMIPGVASGTSGDDSGHLLRLFEGGDEMRGQQRE